MEIATLIYKLADHLDRQDTQELLLTLEIKTEVDMKSSSSDLNKEIDEELYQLQIILNDKQNIEEIASIFETTSVSLEIIYLNTDLKLDKLLENAVGREELHKGISTIINRRK